MRIIIIELIAFVVVPYFYLYSQWSDDPYINTRVSDWGVLPMAVEDGNGGAFVTFYNPGYDPIHCYLQKINFDGIISWADPIRISNVNDGNYSSTTGMFLTDDGSKQLIVGYLSGIIYFDTTLGRYEDRLNPYVQKFDSNGNKLWGEEGIRLKEDTTKLVQAGILSVPDNKGGTICLWTYYIYETYNRYLWLQHVSESGELLWGNDGGILISDSIEGSNIWMVSDDYGGIIIQYIKWIQNQRHCFIQRFDSTGTLMWTLEVSLAFPSAIRDGEGGIIVSEIKEYYPEKDTLFVNRISHNGEKLWGENGIGIFNTEQYNIEPILHINMFFMKITLENISTNSLATGQIISFPLIQ